MKDVGAIQCPVCGVTLKITTSRSKRGKVALVLACPEDGRHIRAFLNDPTYVRQVLEALEVRSDMG